MVSELKYIELSSLLLEKPRNGLYKSKEYQGRGNRWIKMKEVFNTDFLLNQETELIEVTNSELKKFSCRPGDLLFGRTSLTLEGVGDCLLVGEIQDTPIFESNLFRVRFDDNKADSLFYYYFFKSKAGKQLIQKIAKQTAAASITSSDLVSQFVPYYPLEYQKSVSQLIYQFDEKIELNRQINETLEAMAQALFKSWFVDFDPVIDNALLAGNSIPEPLKERAEMRQAQLDSGKANSNSKINDLFPSEFEFTEELGWIPKGWSVQGINKLVDSISITYPLKMVDKVIFLNTGDIQNGKFLHSDYSNVDGLPGQAKKSIRKHDILYSEIRPKNKRFAYVNFEADEYVVSTKLMVLRAIGEVKSIFTYFYLKQDYIVSTLQHMAESRSGTFPQITFDVLSQLAVGLPDDLKLVNYFTENILEPFFERINHNEQEANTLAKLRDTLLPKLMSGELRIPDAEKLAADI